MARRGSARVPDRYRESLRTAVGTSAGPYGYTLATWTTGAVLTHARGTPTTLDAFLFVAGAVTGSALVGALAFGGVTRRFAREPRHTALWGSFHFLSVGDAIGAATLVAHVAGGWPMWLLAPCSSTVAYLLVLGAQFAAAEEDGSEDPQG